MKRATFLLCFIAMGMLLAQPYKSALANKDTNAYTGNALIHYCNVNNSNASNALWALCLGTIHGVTTGVRLGIMWGYREATGTNPTASQIQKFLSYCTPPSITRQQIALTVSKYLYEHPDELNKSDIVLVITAIEQAWPCPKEKH